MSFSIVYKQISKKKLWFFGKFFFFNQILQWEKIFCFVENEIKGGGNVWTFLKIFFTFVSTIFLNKMAAGKLRLEKIHNSSWRNYKKYEEVSNNLSLKNSDNW